MPQAIDAENEPLTRLGLLLAAYTLVRFGALRGMRWDESRVRGAIGVIPEGLKSQQPQLQRPSSALQANARTCNSSSMPSALKALARVSIFVVW